MSTPKDVPVCPLVCPPHSSLSATADSAKDKQAIRLKHEEAAPGLCPSQEATAIQARGLQGRAAAAGPQGERRGLTLSSHPSHGHCHGAQPRPTCPSSMSPFLSTSQVTIRRAHGRRQARPSRFPCHCFLVPSCVSHPMCPFEVNGYNSNGFLLVVAWCPRRRVSLREG